MSVIELGSCNADDTVLHMDLRHSDPHHALDATDAGAFEDDSDGADCGWSECFDEDDIALAILAFEADDDSTSQSSSKSGHAPQRHLSDVGETRQRRVNLVTEEDFEAGDERQSFIYLRSRIRVIFADVLPEHRWAAIEWTFRDGPNIHDAEPPFELICRALGCRPDVLRFRIQLEWWRNWATMDQPFPFTVRLPYLIANDIRYFYGQQGMYVAISAYRHPSITTEGLIDAASELSGFKSSATQRQEIVDIIRDMEARRMLSAQGNNWYLTGRNPLLLTPEQALAGIGERNIAALSWSSYWPEED